MHARTHTHTNTHTLSSASRLVRLELAAMPGARAVMPAHVDHTHRIIKWCVHACIHVGVTMLMIRL